MNKKPLHSSSDQTHVSDVTSHDIPTRSSKDMHMNYSRLPKLHLPTFDGNPLQWQTFWDSFSAAMDSNPCLTENSGIQKFNYLHAQLQGDASRIISGFPLSDTNYAHLLELLRERFGQQYKLVDAHMDALLNVSPPSNTLTSLQTFYDRLQSHIRTVSIGQTISVVWLPFNHCYLGQITT